MNEIKCTKCGTVFQINEEDYELLVEFQKTEISDFYVIAEDCKSLITESDDIYEVDGRWTYRGFMNDVCYCIEAEVTDEYGKTFTQEVTGLLKEWTSKDSIFFPV